MDVTVRRVLGHEGAMLREVRLAALKESPSAFGSSYEKEAGMTDADWAARARASAAGVDRVTFVAVAGDKLVGLLGGYRPDPSGPEVELVSMWTSPDARRAGVARVLVDAVLAWARETGATTLSLWVTRGNVPAQQLYESAGFRETGAHQPLPSDPCKDETRMTRAL
jgi:GNAT superfamily N-acetyltransferase